MIHIKAKSVVYIYIEKVIYATIVVINGLKKKR